MGHGVFGLAVGALVPPYVLLSRIQRLSQMTGFLASTKKIL